MSSLGMQITTDDGPRNLRAPLLGFEGKAIHPQWTFKEWGLFLTTTPTVALILWLVLWTVTGVWLMILPAALAGALAGVAVRYWLAPVLDIDRPIAYLRRLARSELRAWIWTRGPYDHRAIAWSAGIGFIAFGWGTAFLPSARAAIAVAAVVGWLARMVFAWREPADRNAERTAEHEHRKAGSPWSARFDPTCSVERLAANLVVDAAGVWAVYRMGHEQWFFTSDDQRVTTTLFSGSTWSSLEGHDLAVDLLRRPVLTSQWAKDLDDSVANPLPPSGDWSWQDKLERVQRHMKDALSEDVRILAVRLCDPPHDDAITEHVLDLEARVFANVRGTGITAERASTADVRWYQTRRYAPGHPAALNEPPTPALRDVAWEAVPFGRTVKVTRNGVERHLVTLTMTHEMEPVDPTDGRRPWLATLDGLTLADHNVSVLDHVDVHVTARVVGKEAYRSDAKGIKDRTADIIGHHDEHGVELSDEQRDAWTQAKAIADDVSRGRADRVARVKAVVRFVVFGDTPRQALAIAEAVRARYQSAHGMKLIVQRGAGSVLTETLPWRSGPSRSVLDKATLAHPGFERWMPVTYWAAAVPCASRELGTPTGLYAGFDPGSRTPRLIDWWYPMAHNGSGVTRIAGTSGAGKTAAAARAGCDAMDIGALVTGLCPSERLHRLCDIPRYQGRARHLSTARLAGTLNPMHLVPDPPREICSDDGDWQDRKDSARSERVDLTTEAISGLLPADEARRVAAALRVAASEVAASTRNPWHVIDRLAEDHEFHRVARLLEEEAKGRGRLIFPSRREAELLPVIADEQLVVVTLPHLTLPDPGTARSEWTDPQRWGAAKLNLVAQYAALRSMYVPIDLPKMLILDEAHVLHLTPTGVQFMARKNRDSRKLNEAVLELSQDPLDHDRIGTDSCVGQLLMFRQTMPKAQAAALASLGIPRGVGYEDTLRVLADGEAIYKDFFGRIGPVQFDMDVYPELQPYIYTTPQRQDRVERLELAA